MHSILRLIASVAISAYAVGGAIAADVGKTMNVAGVKLLMGPEDAAEALKQAVYVIGNRQGQCSWETAVAVAASVPGIRCYDEERQTGPKYIIELGATK